MRKIFCSIIMLLALAPTLQAASLPPVVNLQLQGDVLTWDEVESATDYNIYLRGYYATVRGNRSITLSEVGTYSITAFNDAGDFSPLRGADRIEFSDGEDNRPNFFTLTDDIVYQTVRCFDLEAGGTCEARCPDFIAQSNAPGYVLSSATGGACSSSDINNVNTHIDPKMYGCTVSSFTSRVEAQVVCMVDSRR